MARRSSKNRKCPVGIRIKLALESLEEGMKAGERIFRREKQLNKEIDYHRKVLRCLFPQNKLSLKRNLT